MHFSKNQIDQINNFILKYNHDEAFRTSVEDKYDNAIYELSILDIYVLEEILRYGSKAIYGRYIILNESETNLEFYNMYMNRLTHDKDFCKSKLSELYNISKEEAFIIYTFLKCIADKNDIKVEEKIPEDLGYDTLNTVNYSTDEELMNTLRNVILGSLIIKLVDEVFPSFKKYQYRKGQFSKKAKSFLIKFINDTLPQQKDSINLSAEYIFDITKYILNTNEKDVIIQTLSECLTNISYSEVFEKDKDLKK